MSSGLLAVGDPVYGERFPARPATRLEVTRIAEAYRKAFPQEREPRVLIEKDASLTPLHEALSMKKDKRWRYLYLATHGFFKSARENPAKDGPLTFEEVQKRGAHERDPLLLSGLALSDASLTAADVAGLDLRGVDMAVLSTSDTGPGDFGLQRAFHAAGVRSVVASLWSIDDAATSVLMEEFYANLWSKKMTKLEALRQAQITVLKNPDRVEARRKEIGNELTKRGIKTTAKTLPGGGKIENRSHPALWAGFVLSGDGK